MSNNFLKPNTVKRNYSFVCYKKLHHYLCSSFYFVIFQFQFSTHVSHNFFFGQKCTHIAFLKSPLCVRVAFYLSSKTRPRREILLEKISTRASRSLYRIITHTLSLALRDIDLFSLWSWCRSAPYNTTSRTNGSSSEFLFLFLV